MWVWGWRVVVTNTVGCLILLAPKQGKSRNLQQMMTQFRKRSDYLEVAQWISEFWIMSGKAEKSDYLKYSVVKGDGRQVGQTGRTENMLKKKRLDVLK